MSKKKWTGRKAYLNDFRMNVAGEYVYTGKVYHWGSDRKAELKRLWGLAATAGAASLTSGCISGTGMEGAAWVLLPYMLSLIGVVTVIWGLARLTTAGVDIREYVFQATVEQLSTRCVFVTICSGSCVIGDLVNVFLPSFGGTPWRAVVLGVLQMVIIICSVLFRRAFVSFEWTK